MPGIAGFTRVPSLQDKDAKIILRDMQNLITHQDFYKKDELFCDKCICATRVHINVIQKSPQPYIESNIYIWLDGEFYNQDELIPHINYAEKSDAEILLCLYREDDSLSFLKKIDGIYSAVIYDSQCKKIYLIKDRYGLRHLYCMIHNGSLVWSSEVKAMLAFPDFIPKIDRRAMKEFFEIGYILENRTWFEGIELMPSGTVSTWDISSRKLNKQRYWWWNEIKPSSQNISENEIIEQLSFLFSKSVRKRVHSEERMGLLLSGGLDSRTILAALPENGYSLDVLTFGKKGCDDIRIAVMAAKKKNAAHHIFILDSNNWLRPRLNGVWATDGQMDLMHMHGIEASERMRDLFDVALDGFAGDLILGGSYIGSRTDWLDSAINKEIASKVMRCSPDLIPELSGYSDLNKIDFFFLQNRVRRFTLEGTYRLDLIQHRMPFYDNKLMEFIYSLPDKLRFEHNIYKCFVLRKFPDFFKAIPWQKTGLPINSPFFIEFLWNFRKRIFNKLIRIGIKLNKNHGYTDYPDWIREEPAKIFFKQVLVNPNALYPEYVSFKKVSFDLDSHFNGKDRSENLCRYLTFEIWLQQVFNGKYREGICD